MVETPNLALPYLVANQAQKHVTVNEALFRLDAYAQLVLRSLTKTEPDSDSSDGECYFVPANPQNDFAMQNGKIALKMNGGWVFVTCQKGWKAYVIDEAALMYFDGEQWLPVTEVRTPNNAFMSLKYNEKTITLSAGNVITTDLFIPKYAMVFGVTGRILTAFSGTASGWKLGVGDAPDRYASAMGLTKGSWLVGMGSSPLTYYERTPLTITAEGGSLSGGAVLLCLNYIELAPPAP